VPSRRAGSGFSLLCALTTKVFLIVAAIGLSACWDDTGLPCREACDHLADCGVELDIDCSGGCKRLVNYECETCVSIRTCAELASATANSPCPCSLRN
jgi:hypothetical protein